MLRGLGPHKPGCGAGQPLTSSCPPCPAAPADEVVCGASGSDGDTEASCRKKESF